MLNGFVSDNINKVIGAKSSNGRCAEEVACMLDPASTQCKALQPTSTGNSTTSISDDGLIFQCDDTNTDGECHLLDDCYESSIFPSCMFVLALTSTIIKQPELIKNSVTKHLDQQSYLLFYSDPECVEFEGLKGFVSGPSVELVQTSDSVSCEDAMSCLLAPGSDLCKEKGGVTGSTTRVFTETRNNGRDAYQCSPPDSSTDVAVSKNAETRDCDEMESKGCIRSTIHPSCYFRWTSATRFMEDPGSFLNSPTKTPSVPNEPSVSSSTNNIAATVSLAGVAALSITLS